MLNRRHLRVKVLQALYAYYQSTDADATVSEKELFKSVDRIYELYIYLLLTFEELQRQGERRLEEGKNKMLVYNNIRNKLLKRVFAVINRQQPYVNVHKFAA